MNRIIKKSQTNNNILFPSSSNNKIHERSLDNFLKQIKKYNLKSQRYQKFLSPKPFSMYHRKNHQINQTLERSRTLSGKHSVSKKISKTLRKNIQKIFDKSSSKKKREKIDKNYHSPQKLKFQNPGEKIEIFSNKIKEVERLLENKSKVGKLLCDKFLQMLNEIVEDMIKNLQINLEELEANISTRLQKEINERSSKENQKLKKYILKMQKRTKEVLEKQNYNTNLIYHLRLNNLDVDRQFGRCAFGSDDFGGCGYKKSLQMEEQSEKSDFVQYKFEKPQKKDLKEDLFFEKYHHHKKIENQLIVSSSKLVGIQDDDEEEEIIFQKRLKGKEKNRQNEEKLFMKNKSK